MSPSSSVCDAAASEARQRSTWRICVTRSASTMWSKCVVATTAGTPPKVVRTDCIPLTMWCWRPSLSKTVVPPSRWVWITLLGTNGARERIALP